MTAQSANPEKLFTDISQFIVESRTLLEQGAMTELAGLDKQVRILCDAVLQLSQDDRLAYAERLQEILNGLTALGNEMLAQREALADAIRSVPQFKKANTAYRVVDASDGYKGEEDE